MSRATKTAPKVSDNNSDAGDETNLERFSEAMTTAALNQWQEWATGVANGGKLPPAKNFVEVAAVLEIARPALEMKADIEALKMFQRFEASLARAGVRAAAVLAPFGGTAAGLRDATEAARRELLRLEQLRDTGGRVMAITAGITALQTAHRRIWPKPTKSHAMLVREKNAAKREAAAAAKSLLVN